MRTGTIARGIAVTGAVLLAVTACGGGSDDSGSSDQRPTSSEKQVKIYGTDGNMGNALGEKFTEQGSLAGMKGTLPLTDLSSDFKDRLKTVDPKLQDFNYAGESYDARARSRPGRADGRHATTPTGSAPYVNGVTFGGDKCKDFESCLAHRQRRRQPRLRRRHPVR